MIKFVSSTLLSSRYFGELDGVHFTSSLVAGELDDQRRYNRNSCPRENERTMHCERGGVFAQSVLNEYEDDGEGIGTKPKDRRTGLRAPGELTAHFQSHREKEETEDTN